MTQSDDSDAKAKPLEFVAHALKEHEKKIDSSLRELETVKGNLITVTRNLSCRAEKIVKKMDDLKNQTEKLKAILP